MKKNITLFAAMTLAGALQMVSAADITGTITLKGTPPAEKALPLDPQCEPLHKDKATTHFYVVDAKGDLADAVVYLKGVSAKSTGASAAPVGINQQGCEYTPTILAVQTGQTIRVKNSDPFMHNVHTVSDGKVNNTEYNKPQMGGAADFDFSFDKPEMFLKFKCDVHPWMFTWVSVFDHPFFALSGKDGSYKISNVPAGKYTLVVAHRKAGTKEQEIEVKDGNVSQDFSLDVPAAK